MSQDKKVISPICYFEHIHVNKPDPEYKDYKMTGHFDPSTPEGQAFVARVKKDYAEATKAARAAGTKVGEPPLKKSTSYEGFVMFKTRSKFQPKVFNGRNDKVDLDARTIFTGSTGRVSMLLDAYKTQGAGLTLRLVNAQIITFASAPSAQDKSEFDVCEFAEAEEGPEFPVEAEEVKSVQAPAKEEEAGWDF